MIKRKKTKLIKVGDVLIGDNNPISIQSMTTTDTKDVKASIDQINNLEKAGCDIVRLAINDKQDALALEQIKKNIKIPIIADIQYDYKLAIWSAKYGADCLRINPGNIGSKNKVKEIVNICKEKNIPIRIGVNSGSIHKKYLEKYGGVNESSLVYSAIDNIKLLESMDFFNFKVSIKASDVRLTIKSYEKISNMIDYPLHIGITESGPVESGTIKSSVGIGSILSRGIGDTIRVSLTGDPVEEVYVAKNILKSLGLYKSGVEIISCPTCSRTKIDLISLVNEVEIALKDIDKPIKVALMGCAVNGPGEAKEADIGIAAGLKEAVLFKKGVFIKKVKEEDLLTELSKEINLL